MHISVTVIINATSPFEYNTNTKCMYFKGLINSAIPYVTTYL